MPVAAGWLASQPAGMRDASGGSTGRPPKRRENDVVLTEVAA